MKTNSGLLYFFSFLLLLLLQVVSPQDEQWPQCAGPSNDGSCPIPTCPDCSLVDCLPKITQDDCPEGSILEPNLVFGGCCPACVKYLQRGDFCNGTITANDRLSKTHVLPCTVASDDEEQGGQVRILREAFEMSGSLFVPVIYKPDCGPDTICTDGLCVNATLCTAAQTAYDVWLDQSEATECELYDWVKRCDPWGTYHKVQSKTNVHHPSSRQFCYSPEGDRLFGSAANNDPKIGCRCSRKVWELREVVAIGQEEVVKARTDVTLHCQEDGGNFEPLQCDQERCWCVDPSTGAATSGVVLQTLASLLHCFDQAEFGEGYLRTCESRAYVKALTRQKLDYHGLTWRETDGVSCDLDGSFGPVRCDQEQCRCVNKYNQQITNYFTEAANRGDCKCARDQWAGLAVLQCTSSTGTYRQVQSFSEKEYCVDEDGFQATASYTMTSVAGQKCAIAHCPERIKYCTESPCDPACVKEC